MQLYIVFFLGLSLALIAFAYTWHQVAIGDAVAVGCAVSLLTPTWAKLTIWDSPISVRWTFVAVAMLLFAVTHYRQIRSPLILTDLFVAGIVVSHVSSAAYHQGESLLAPVRAYSEWALPYVAGRYAMTHSRNYILAAKAFSVACIAIALPAIFETFAGINPWETYLLAADDEVRRPSARRYDLFFRSNGPFQHPIFLGIASLLLIPWGTLLFSLGRTAYEKALGAMGATAAALGVLASVSRGPILALIIAILFAAASYSKSVRRCIAIAAMLCTGLLLAYPSKALELADATDNNKFRGKIVATSDGQELYTGTRARIFVWRVYGPLVLKGGLFGYGDEASSTFPPNIPGLPANAESRKILGYVDNSYLLIGLRLGILGCAFFTAIVISAITNAIRLTREGSELFYPHQKLVFTIFSSILFACALEILTVFSSYDFIFWLLFTVGCTAGLRVASTIAARADLNESLLRL